MDIQNAVFKRRFSTCFYKDLTLSLGKMSFAKDFVNTDRGDLYPVLTKSGGAIEEVSDGTYRVEKGEVRRFFTSFFPYASYEIKLGGGKAGLSFYYKNEYTDIIFSENAVEYLSCDIDDSAEINSDNISSFIVSARPGAFDIYTKSERGAMLLCTFEDERFADSGVEKNFKKANVSLYAKEGASVLLAESYMDSGISIADIRPIRYENLEIMREGGRVFFTASVRLEAGCYQGIFSWVPASAEFSLCGALFFDAGNGVWNSDVASSLIYNRMEEKWQLWVCSFGNGHILGHAEFEGDVRFGLNVLDIELMEKADENDPRTVFKGFEGDEDPDFFYDKENERWLMSVCRLDPDCKGYRYFFFESKDPFCGYEYVGKGLDGAETGGSFVKIDGNIYFSCGNDFKKRANYRIYSDSGMKEMSFDYDDGGFRGWGSILPIKLGTRERYFLITFDRHCGSAYNWSYGNLYLFEAEE